MLCCESPSDLIAPPAGQFWPSADPVPRTPCCFSPTHTPTWPVPFQREPCQVSTVCCGFAVSIRRALAWSASLEMRACQCIMHLGAGQMQTHCPLSDCLTAPMCLICSCCTFPPAPQPGRAPSMMMRLQPCPPMCMTRPLATSGELDAKVTQHTNAAHRPAASVCQHMWESMGCRRHAHNQNR